MKHQKIPAILIAALAASLSADAVIVGINALDLRSTGIFGHANATLTSGPGAITADPLDWVISYSNLNLDGDGTANDTVNFTVRASGGTNQRAFNQGVDTGFGNLNDVTFSVINVSGTTTDSGDTIVFDGFTGGAIGVGGNGDIDRTAEINGTLASVTSANTDSYQFKTSSVDFAATATIVYDNSGDSDFDGNGDGGFGTVVARNHDLQFSTVPEPSSAVALFGLVAGLVVLRRRR